MRVLWFTNTPSNYLNKTTNNGGGWISSLETVVSHESDIELGICFILDNQPNKIKAGRVIYYPLKKRKLNVIGKIRWLVDMYNNKVRLESPYLPDYMRVINDFKPDIIHVFGTELDYGLISLHTKIPVLIHIQGLLVPCLNAYFPPGLSKYQYFVEFFKLKSTSKRILDYLYFIKSASREKIILKNNFHYLGRTKWDHNIISVFNHNATYDYCSEILREVFYGNTKLREIPEKLVLTTTISAPPFKGLDIVFKCAALLESEFNIDFEWNVFGNIYSSLYKRLDKKYKQHHHIKLLGIADQNKIKEQILSSTVFVHPSYIDNSPNSVCEAQILGCPVVAQDVGGLSSLVENGVDGFLTPANDPYQMTLAIVHLYEDKGLNIKMGQLGNERALLRHDKKEILKSLKKIYTKYEH